MAEDYSYISDKNVIVARAKALEIIMDRDGPDDLWSYCHSVMMFMVMESQHAKYASTYDGIYNLPKGEFDVNVAATWLQIALEVREQFLRDKAENDKSG